MESLIDTPIDFERLRDISDGDAEMLDTLLEMYLEQIRETLVVLKTAIAEKNFNSVGKAAHKAVGSSATCGMNVIVPPLKKLEQLGFNRNLETAEELLAQTESAYNQIRALLEINKNKIL